MSGTPTPAPPEGLYVHVPFCVSRCPYCDFVVYAGASARGPRNRISTFMAALLAELDLRADIVDARHGPPGSRGRPPLASVYLGGGTPSLLPADEVGGLLALVRKRFGIAADGEVTIEVNPGPGERGDIRLLAEAGVTRVSVGAQRMDRAELRQLGRRHDPDDVADTVAGARDAGVRSVSLDLLYELPGDTLDAWRRTLDRALALAPDHLSLYALTLDDPDGEGVTGQGADHLPTTRGARAWRERARRGQDEDVAADAYTHAADVLASRGYRGYEISNWARPGHESRHNLAYWERRSWEAVGPGAHAFDGAVRRWNAANLDRYVAALLPGDGTQRLPPGSEEVVDSAAAHAETIMLGLRTDRGVPAELVRRPPLDASLEWGVEAELLALTSDDRIVLTTRGRLLSNEVFSRLV